MPFVCLFKGFHQKSYQISAAEGLSTRAISEAIVDWTAEKDGGESCELQDQIEAAGFERQALPVPAEQRCAWQWSARGSQSVHQQVKADQAGRFGAQADELPDDATGAAAHFEYSQLRKVRNPAAVEQSGQVLPAVRIIH